jgi:hypothetical protein
MTINLENYLNKEVEVELHNGKIVKGVIAKYGQNGKIMYQIADRSFGYVHMVNIILGRILTL